MMARAGCHLCCCCPGLLRRYVLGSSAMTTVAAELSGRVERELRWRIEAKAFSGA